MGTAIVLVGCSGATNVGVTVATIGVTFEGVGTSLVLVAGGELVGMITVSVGMLENVGVGDAGTTVRPIADGTVGASGIPGVGDRTISGEATTVGTVVTSGTTTEGGTFSPLPGTSAVSVGGSPPGVVTVPVGVLSLFAFICAARIVGVGVALFTGLASGETFTGTRISVPTCGVVRPASSSRATSSTTSGSKGRCCNPVSGQGS